MRTFRILTVCTGNVCRSPLAEQLLQTELAGLRVEVSSAGTEALVGRAMDDRAARYSEKFGAVSSAHRARQLTVEHLRDTDLVLTAAREHRRKVVETWPRASQFTFTIREFARLLNTLNIDDEADIAGASDEAGRVDTLVGVLASNRGVAEPLENPADDDIIDPYRQSDDVYAESARLIVDAVRSVASGVRRAAAFIKE